jgi:cytochrome c553
VSPRVKVYARTALVLCAAAAVGGFALAASGLYSVAASKGHWPFVEWVLEFGLRQSVRTHTIGLETPPLDDPAMVAAGLGHYEIACASCHGAPGQPLNPITLQMLPSPPFLPERVAEWKPKQLFWITKHGLKYTGMPGWAAYERDDEVWSIVAALVRLPEMTAAQYRARVANDTRTAPEDETETMRRFVSTGPAGSDLVACARCHGIEGEGGGDGAFPRLANQNAAYLRQTMDEYASGARRSGIRGPIAAALDANERRRVADYYAARRPPPAPAPPADSGRVLARSGDASRGIPVCGACHGTAVEADSAISPRYPRLAGQHAWYLRQQLALWRDGRRGETPLAGIMTAAARNLTDADIAAVAAYYAGLAPLPPVAAP